MAAERYPRSGTREETKDATMNEPKGGGGGDDEGGDDDQQRQHSSVIDEKQLSLRSASIRSLPSLVSLSLRSLPSLRTVTFSLRAPSIDLKNLPDNAPPTLEAYLQSTVGMLDDSEAAAAGRRGGSSSPSMTGVVAVLVGTMLEFYDFSVYAFFAPEVGRLFFPQSQVQLRAVKTFSVYAGGFLMRPLGALLLGAVGDQWGTAVALKWSIALMAIPTVATGCLPTHQQVGPAAAVLLTALRLLQGMSVGGELVGAMLHTSDNKKGASRRGLWCGLVSACSVFGTLLGSGVATITHRHLPESELLRWGWRVPFLCGSLLGLVGIILRTKGGDKALPPPPSTTVVPPSTPPHGSSTPTGTSRRAAGASSSSSSSSSAARVKDFIAVFKNVRASDVPNLLLVALLAAMLNLLFYTNVIWLGTYLSSLAGPSSLLDPFHSFAVVSVLQAILIVAIPAFGYIADRTGGRLYWIAAGVAVTTVAQPLLWRLLEAGTPANAYIFAACMGPLVGLAVSGNYWGWVTECLHNGPARYLSLAVAYNIGAMLGGTYPTIASALTKSDVFVAPVLPVSALGVVVLLVLAARAMAIVLRRPPTAASGDADGGGGVYGVDDGEQQEEAERGGV